MVLEFLARLTLLFNMNYLLKTLYISVDKLGIYDLLERSDGKLYDKISKDQHHPLYLNYRQ